MKRIFTVLFFVGWIFNSNSVFATWRRSNIVLAARSGQHPFPKHYLVYTTDETALKSQLFSCAAIPANGHIIELPMPDGSLKRFRVWYSSLMPEALAAKYPELRTFTAEAIDNQNITAKLDFTVYGFHAMIFNGTDVSFIDPADDIHSGNYVVHYKRDELRNPGAGSVCLVAGNSANRAGGMNKSARKMVERVTNGYVLRTYRLALACSNEYAQAATGTDNPTIAQTLSKMATTINRVNGVYERELSVTLNFVANEDTLIWPVVSGSVNGADPYDAINSDAGSCLITNQTTCDARIGKANYDIGHVFTTGAGGLSEVGVVCDPLAKAQSVTGQPDPVGDGFDIDYVAHEMGHEFGGNHPFNNGVDGSCAGGNINPPTAYEPGSGSTIMAYAGICAPDNLQPHSDAYFNSVNLQELQSYITTGGDGCAVKTATNNKLVDLPPFTASYTIPYLTPFELTAPAATDSVTDSVITYCWEQWNLPDADDLGAELKNTHYTGPIFRSYFPAISPTRIFPENSMVLAGILSNADINDSEGEKAPDVGRYLTFKLTMRDIYQGTGCFLVPDDSIHLNVIQEDTGFYVTSQNTAGLIYFGSSTQQVTWHVAGTNAAPISTPNVDIYMSFDGGNTWPYYIGNFINNGSALLSLPNPDSTVTTARIKVKGSGNVFFNVNRTNFTIDHGTLADTVVMLYPVPAHSTIRLSSGNKGLLHVSIFNSVGQQIWKNDVDGEIDIDVSTWARGVYIMRLIDSKNEHLIKEFVVD